jgi:exosome complex component RRP42
MSRDIVSEIKRDYIHNLAASGKRADDRKFDEVRPITIERGLIDTAEGSARVKLGRTDVLVGVKVGIGEPFPDTSDKGVLTTNAELKPLAYAGFEMGPPREEAIELSRVVDRCIRESKTMDLGKLCITPEEKVWIVYIDIHVLDYDGNLFDAATIGALAALANTTVPAARFEVGDDYKLPVEHFPIATTIVKIGDSLIVDPELDEERVSGTRITIATDENGDIRAMQKGSEDHFNMDELKRALKLAQEAGNKVRNQFPYFQQTEG